MASGRPETGEVDVGRAGMSSLRDCLIRSIFALVVTSSSRRAAALAALSAVVAGARVEDVESDLVDFKEESGTVRGDGSRGPIPPRHDPAAQQLAIEVACMANTTTGGVLVVGVDDRGSGPSALRDTYLDTDWLRTRIAGLTSPAHAVDLIEEVREQGHRLYLINVHPGVMEISVADKLRMRRGRECLPVEGADALRLLQERRGFDWSAQPSGVRLSQATLEAMLAARRFWRERRGDPPSSDRDLANRMGVLVDHGDDPELNRAGALLLADYEPGLNQVQFLITKNEGAVSSEHLRGGAPLLPLLDEVFTLLQTAAFPLLDPPRGRLVRRDLRAIPETAFREALVNAVMHREYQLGHMVVIALATGTPASTLKVRSPGGFPPAANAQRLLSGGSHPRNEALANAMRVIGVAEREGVGISSMYRAMIRDGHEPPEVIEDAGDVVVRLAGGAPDIVLRDFYDHIETADPALEDNVAVPLAISYLLTSSPLRPETLARLAERTPGEAAEMLGRLRSVGVIEPIWARGRSFRFTRESQNELGTRVRSRRTAVGDHWSRLHSYLMDSEPEIKRETAAEVLAVTPANASRLLSTFVKQRKLEFVGGTRRGRDVRYRLAKP